MQSYFRANPKCEQLRLGSISFVRAGRLASDRRHYGGEARQQERQEKFDHTALACPMQGVRAMEGKTGAAVQPHEKSWLKTQGYTEKSDRSRGLEDRIGGIGGDGSLGGVGG